MHDRAQSIGAKLKVWSRPSGGTEVGLAVPGGMAFQSETEGSLSKWLSKMYLRGTDLSKIKTPK